VRRVLGFPSCFRNARDDPNKPKFLDWAGSAFVRPNAAGGGRGRGSPAPGRVMVRVFIGCALGARWRCSRASVWCAQGSAQRHDE
jgi:hypothetical protein